jgi:hypothetical protein
MIRNTRELHPVYNVFTMSVDLPDYKNVYEKAKSFNIRSEAAIV